MRLITIRLPGNSARATACSYGYADEQSDRVAAPETARESPVIPKLPESGVNKREKAFWMPSKNQIHYFLPRVSLSCRHPGRTGENEFLHAKFPISFCGVFGHHEIGEKPWRPSVLIFEFRPGLT